MNGILFLAVSIMPSTSEYPVKVFNFLTTEVLKKCHSANPSYDLASMAHWTRLGQTLGYTIRLLVILGDKLFKHSRLQLLDNKNVHHYLSMIFKYIHKHLNTTFLSSRIKNHHDEILCVCLAKLFLGQNHHKSHNI